MPLHGIMECWARSEAFALLWNNGQIIDIVSVVPAFHYSPPASERSEPSSCEQKKSSGYALLFFGEITN